VLVLVDATRFAEDLADRWLTDTLERQVARADIVAISKCDAGDAAVATTRAALERLRPEVAVLEIFGGAVPAALLGLAETAPASRFLADAPDHGFRAWHWPIERPLHARVLAGVLDGLPGSVLRAKGFCRLGPAGAVHALQRVGRRWNLTPWEGEVPGFGLVLIGTAAMPAEAALQAVFAAAVLQ
jgi:G3E family GTPase